IIEFGFCSSPEEAGQYLSASYDLICFDELTEFDEESYMLIKSRARTSTEKAALGARPHVVACTNPGQRGHAWVKGRFVQRETTEGTALEPTRVGNGWVWEHTETNPRTGEEVPRRVGFLPSTVFDN